MRMPKLQPKNCEESKQLLGSFQLWGKYSIDSSGYFPATEQKAWNSLREIRCLWSSNEDLLTYFCLSLCTSTNPNGNLNFYSSLVQDPNQIWMETMNLLMMAPPFGKASFAVGI